MRQLPAPIQEIINRRGPLIVRRLFWIKARNRQTNAHEELGIWSGEDNYEFLVDGNPRIYYGAGNFLSTNAIEQQKGLVIRRLVVTATPISAEMATVMRQYDPKFAPCELHLAFLDPESENLVANPFRVFKGWVDTMPINTPAKNESGNVTINCVGNSRILTRVYPAKRSDATQRLRNPNDKFFDKVAITGTIRTPWGSKSV